MNIFYNNSYFFPPLFLILNANIISLNRRRGEVSRARREAKSNKYYIYLCILRIGYLDLDIKKECDF